jgi:hypothetical protein
MGGICGEFGFVCVSGCDDKFGRGYILLLTRYGASAMKYPFLIDLLDNIDFRIQTQKLFDPEFVDHGEKIGVHFVRGHVFARFHAEALRVHGEVGVFVHAE